MKNDEKLVIKVEQRNGRKAWTIVENLDVLQLEEIKLKELVKFFKKKLSCNGCLKKDKEDDHLYIQFQGKHADTLKTILEEKELISGENITLIGDF